MGKTISISQEEYEKLRSALKKIEIIDRTIHNDFLIKELMNLQSNQESLSFLSKEDEDIYSYNDIKEVF